MACMNHVGAAPGTASERCRHGGYAVSVELELALVILAQTRVLTLLRQIAVPRYQDLDLAPHEAAKRVLRRANNRFTPNVEARVHQHRATRPILERRQQRMIPRVRVPVHRL